MMIFQVIILLHNLFYGLDAPNFIATLCTALRVIIILADIISIILIMRNISIGVWINVSTAFFLVLLSLAFPGFMTPFILAINFLMKIGLLLVLFFKHNELTGYQTLGMVKIDGQYIDEWITGRKRYM